MYIYLIYNHGQEDGKGDSIVFKKIQKVCLTVDYEIISIKKINYQIWEAFSSRMLPLTEC